MTNKTIELFESIIGKKPDAFLHEPVYQVTESELLEFAQKLAAPEAPRQQPIGWFTDDYLTDKSATTYDELTSNRWKDKGWPIQPLYAAPLSPDHSGGGAGMVVTSAAEAFSKGFNLLEQTDGKYRITMAFQNSDDAFDAYRQLAELRKYLDKVKELNQ